MTLAEILEAARQRFWNEPTHTEHDITQPQSARTAVCHYVNEAITTAGAGARLLVEIDEYQPHIDWDEAGELIVGFSGVVEGLRDILTAAITTLLLRDDAELAAEELRRQEHEAGHH